MGKLDRCGQLARVDENVVGELVRVQRADAALKIRPEQGLEVVCTGRISTYPGSSRYQIIVEQVELAGLGALMAMLEEQGDITLAEIQSGLAERGISVGIGTLWRFFNRHGITRKKRAGTRSSKTARTS